MHKAELKNLISSHTFQHLEVAEHRNILRKKTHYEGIKGCIHEKSHRIHISQYFHDFRPNTKEFVEQVAQMSCRQDYF